MTAGLVAFWRRWRPGILATVALHGAVLLGLAIKVRDAAPIETPPSLALEAIPAPPSPAPRPPTAHEQPLRQPAPRKQPLPPIARPDAPSPGFALPPPAPARLPPSPPAPPSPPPAAAAATVASVNRSGSPSPAAPNARASWEADVLTRIEAAKRYPPAARFAHQEATIYVRFNVDRRGKVIGCRLLKPSGFADLDNEVVDLLKRVRLPSPPADTPDAELDLTVPVEFSIGRG